MGFVSRSGEPGSCLSVCWIEARWFSGQTTKKPRTRIGVRGFSCAGRWVTYPVPLVAWYPVRGLLTWTLSMTVKERMAEPYRATRMRADRVRADWLPRDCWRGDCSTD